MKTHLLLYGSRWRLCPLPQPHWELPSEMWKWNWGENTTISSLSNTLHQTGWGSRWAWRPPPLGMGRGRAAGWPCHPWLFKKESGVSSWTPPVFFTVFPKLLHQSSLLSEEEPWVSFYSDVLQLESCWRRRCNASLKKREACFLKLDYNFALASKNLISFDGKLNPALWLAKMLFLLLLVI